MAVKTKKLKILLAEDKWVDYKIHVVLIKALNGSVDVVHTGEAAIAAVQKKPYDLVFMDVGLPDDGIETAEKIRTLKLKHGKQPCIVGLTAFGIREVEKECNAAGMDHVAKKPLHPVWVSEWMVCCLDRKTQGEKS